VQRSGGGWARWRKRGAAAAAWRGASSCEGRWQQRRCHERRRRCYRHWQLQRGAAEAVGGGCVPWGYPAQASVSNLHLMAWGGHAHVVSVT
jgi:hypothetical protein